MPKISSIAVYFHLLGSEPFVNLFLSIATLFLVFRGMPSVGF